MRLVVLACLAITSSASIASASSIQFFGSAGGGTFITDLATDGSLAFLVNGDIDFAQSDSGKTLAVSGTCGGFGCLDMTTGPLDTTLTTSTATGGTNYVYGPTGVGSGLIITGDVGGGSTTLFFAPFTGPINLDVEPAAGGTFSAILSAAVAPGLLDPGLAALLGVYPPTLDGGGFDVIATFTRDPTSGLFFGDAVFNDYEVGTVPVPEPTSLLLLGTGVAAAIARRRRVSRKAA